MHPTFFSADTAERLLLPMQPMTAMFEERILKTKSTHAPSVESVFRMHTNSNCIWIFIPCRRTSSAYIFRLWWSCNIANLVCFILKMFCLFAQYLKCFYIFVWYSFKIKYNLTAILCSWYILYSCRLMWMSWKIYIYIYNWCSNWFLSLSIHTLFLNFAITIHKQKRKYKSMK